MQVMIVLLVGAGGAGEAGVGIMLIVCSSVIIS